MTDALDRAVEERLRRQPARLVHRGEHSATLVTGRPVNHVLHLLATVAFVVDVWLHGTGRSVARTERAA